MARVRRRAGDVTAPVRWLSSEEQDAWKALAGMLLFLPGALDRRLQREVGINFFDYLVLSYLSMSPGHTLRLSELAAMANGSLSRLSNAVKRCEQHGWVRRESDPADGRYTRAVLTESGWDLVVAAAPGHVEAVRELVIDRLSATQLRSLTTIGRLVGEPLAGEGGCGPDRAPV